MKQILPSILSLFLLTSLTAQNNSVKIISKKTHSVINGTVYTVYGDGAVLDIKEEFKAVMESQDSMLVGIKRIELNTIPGTKDYFCWYLCYQPVAAGVKPIWKANDSLWLYRDDTISNFSVYLQPNGTIDSAHYRYVFYPENNPGDSSYLDILFNVVTVGLDEIKNESIQVLPNPASDILKIDLSENKTNRNIRAELYDITGVKVFEGSLKQGRNELNVTGLNNGSYVLRIMQGNDISLNKLIQIQH